MLNKLGSFAVLAGSILMASLLPPPGAAQAASAPAIATRAALASKTMKVVGIKIRQSDGSQTVNVPALTDTLIGDLTASFECPGPGSCILGADVYLQMSQSTTPGLGAVCYYLDNAKDGTCPITEVWESYNYYRNMVDRRYITVSAGNHTIKIYASSNLASSVAARTAEYTIYKNR